MPDESPHPPPDGPDASPNPTHPTSSSPPAPSQPSLSSRLASSTRSLASSLTAPPSAPTSSLLADKSSAASAASSSSTSWNPSAHSGPTPVWHDRLTHLPTSGSGSSSSSSSSFRDPAPAPTDWSLSPDAPTDWAADFHAAGKGKAKPANFTTDLTGELAAPTREETAAQRDAETWIAQFHEAPLDEHAYYRGVVGAESRKSWREGFGGVMGEEDDGEEVRRLLDGALDLEDGPEEAGQTEGREDEGEVDAGGLFAGDALGLGGGGGGFGPDFGMLDPREGRAETSMEHVLGRAGVMREWEEMGGGGYVREVWGGGRREADPGEGGLQAGGEVDEGEEEGRDKAVRRLRGVAGMVGSGDGR